MYLMQEVGSDWYMYLMQEVRSDWYMYLMQEVLSRTKLGQMRYVFLMQEVLMSQLHVDQTEYV